MRASVAYFAGAGTVIVAIVAGLGGGLLISDILSPHGARQPGKLEQRAASQQAQPSPTAGTTANAPQNQVPYLAATQGAASTPVVVAPAPSASAKPDTRVSNGSAAKPAESSTRPEANSPLPATSQQASREQASNPDNAYAKAREADLKQLEAKKKAERRQQWAARRAQQREQEQRDAEQQANEDRRPGEFIVRRDDRDDSDQPDFGRPMRPEFPRINLFGQD